MIKDALLVAAGVPGSLKNMWLYRRLRRSPESAAIWERFFDRAYYVAQNPDVAAAGVSPDIHYLSQGNLERRDPSPLFSTRSYLERYPEVAASGVNALMHYALFGCREGRIARTGSPRRVASGGQAPVWINNEWPVGLPLVSIVIPCFNYGDYVEAAVRSAVNQTFPSIEVIVVEGGSTDGRTPAAVRRLESLRLPKVSFLYRDGRHLAGDNRNFGIAHARGRYVCCLDADDLLKPTYIEAAVYLAETGGYDLVTPSVQSFGDSDALWTLRDPAFPDILDVNMVATAAMFRKSAWAHAGGFRDWALGAEHVCEDWDFWIRLLGHGCIGKGMAEPMLLYRTHAGSVTATSKPLMVEQIHRLSNANARLEAGFHGQPAERVVANPMANLHTPTDDRAVLLAIPFITVGGAEKLFRTIVQGLVQKGTRVLVVTTQDLPAEIPDDTATFEALTPHVYPLSRMFDYDETRADFFLYLLRRYNVRTLMLAGSDFAYRMLPRVKPQFPDVRVVDQLFNGVVHVPNNRKFSGFIDTTLVPSDELRRQMIDQEGADPASVGIIPHGVELPELNASSDVPPAAIFEGKVVVGYFGRLSVEKGPDLFIEIVRQLRADDHLAFIMTGEGPEAARVDELVRRYKLKDRIYMPGFVENAQPLLRRADIVVLPSRIDGMPLIVLESQALRKPVVAARVGSVPAMLTENVTGILCEPGNVAQFCDAIRSLAADAALREQFGAAGRRAVEQKFSSSRMIEQYVSAFDGAPRQHPAVA